MPEVPKHSDDVLIAIQFDDCPVQGCYQDKKWRGIRNVTDVMKYCDVDDTNFQYPEFIYAWAEMPEMPKVPDDFKSIMK